MRRLIPIAVGLVLAACSSEPGAVGPAPDAASDASVDASDGGSFDATADAADASATPDASAEDAGAQDAGSLDTGAADVGLDDAGADGADADVTPKPSGMSPCEVTDILVTCPRETVTLYTDLNGFTPREVHWAIPEGPPPSAGWPAVLLFQGTGASSEFGFNAAFGAPFGGFYQALLTHELLDAGFAVIAPETRFNGTTYWDTNISPWSVSWTLSGDHQVMLDLFDEIDADTFGRIDTSRMYATGISSGGYMTSRMAEAYPVRFRALAIQSASYAWCGGSVCTIPTLPADHPPTLFLHGALDAVVPLFTMDLYHDELVDDGVEVRRVVDPLRAHEWIPDAPTEITDWFLAR